MRQVPESGTPKAFLGEDPNLLAEYRIAALLHMTVHRLRQEMSNEEFLGWTRYLAVQQQSRELAQKQAASRIGR